MARDFPEWMLFSMTPASLPELIGAHQVEGVMLLVHTAAFNHGPSSLLATMMYKVSEFGSHVCPKTPR